MEVARTLIEVFTLNLSFRSQIRYFIGSKSLSHHLPKFEIDVFDKEFYIFCSIAAGADMCKFWNYLFQLKNCTVTVPFAWMEYLRNSV